ncbi:MAG TPA: hypothetical protein VFY50_03075 [Candidatus Nitrosocosmicus sp.]|nr:hypothetical protein [Candidatus Nitrosocosmicus sp.]
MTDAPIQQLFPTTDPKWSVPVSTRVSFTLYVTFLLSSNTFAVPE